MTGTTQHLELIEEADGRIVIVRTTGKLTREDYEQFVPWIEPLIRRHGKIRVLMETRDFSGWTAGGLWEDVKFDVRHFNDIERVAIVGEKKWEHAMALFCKPFTTAKVRYFEPQRLEAARQWIAEGLTPAVTGEPHAIGP